MRQILLRVLVAIVLCTLSPLANGVTTNITASADTFVQYGYSTPYGSQLGFYVGPVIGVTAYGLVYFPLNGIPRGSSIESVTVKVVLRSPASGASVTLATVVNSWSESTIWANMPNVGTTIGSTNCGNTVGGTWSWDSANYPALKTYISGAVSGQTYYGFYFRPTLNSDSREFYTREYSTSSYRPQLVVTYTPPPSVTISMRDLNGNVPGSVTSRGSIVRYSPSWYPMSTNACNSSGNVTFCDADTWTPNNFEAYYAGPDPFDSNGEFWGSAVNISSSTTIQRYMPYCQTVKFYRVDTSAELPSDGSGVVPPGVGVRWQATIQNASPSSYDVRPSLLIDADKDISSGARSLTAGQKNISAGGSAAWSYDFNLPAGGYYHAVKTDAYVKNWTKTDAWDWQPAFTMQPGAPSTVTGTQGDFSDHITVSWSSVTNATAYDVYRGTSSDAAAANYVNTVSGTSLAVFDVQPGTQYYFFVKAVVEKAGGSGGVRSDFSTAATGWAVVASKVIRLAGDLGFPDVQVGGSFQKNVTIFNDGNTTLAVTGISCPSGFAASWSGNIAPGGSQTVTVSFSPVTAGNYVGSLVVASDATSGTASCSISGKGVTQVQTVLSPVISPNGGTFQDSVQVSLSCGTSGAFIHFTTDGSTPTSGSPVYGGAFTLAGSATVKAMATATGYNDSSVASANFIVNGVASTGTNLALQSAGGIASAGSVGVYGTTYYATNANDGNTNTVWANSWNMPDWLQVQFNNLYMISTVGVVWPAGCNNVTYSIALSADGNNWTTVVPSRNSATDAYYDGGGAYHANSTTVRETFSIIPTNARYIRLNVTAGNAPGSYIFKMLVAELEAYGNSSPSGNYTISVSANPSNGGSVGGSGTYTSGSSRTVTASANSGYAFSGWTENGALVSTSSSYTFSLNSNHTLVANFTRLFPVGLSVSDINMDSRVAVNAVIQGSMTIQMWNDTHPGSSCYAAVGIRDSTGMWVGGEPQILWAATPPALPGITQSCSFNGMTVPQVGEYTVYADMVEASSAADAVAAFKNRAVTMESQIGYLTVVVADTQPPTIQITGPTTANSYLAQTNVITIAGVASDNMMIGNQPVRLRNFRDVADMTTLSRFTGEWAIDGVALYQGTNQISVITTDNGGNTATDTVFVVYNGDTHYADCLRSGALVQNIQFPDNLMPGQTVTVQWKILSYVPVRCRLYARDAARTWSFFRNGTYTGYQESSFNLYGRPAGVYSFECNWPVPQKSGEVDIWFNVAQMDADQYMMPMIPDGVDSRPHPTVSKVIQRTILAGGDGTEPVSDTDLWDNTRIFETLDQHKMRSAATVTYINCPDNVTTGSMMTCEWKILSYVPVDAQVLLVNISPAQIYLATTGTLVGSTNTTYTFTDRISGQSYSATEYTYSATFPASAPDGTRGLCFRNRKKGDSSSSWMFGNISIRADSAARPATYNGMCGRFIERTILP